MKFWKECPDCGGSTEIFTSHIGRGTTENCRCVDTRGYVPAHPACGEWNYDMSKLSYKKLVLVRFKDGCIDVMNFDKDLREVYKKHNWTLEENFIAWAEINEQEVGDG